MRRQYSTTRVMLHYTRVMLHYTRVMLHYTRVMLHYTRVQAAIACLDSGGSSHGGQRLGGRPRAGLPH